MTTVLLVGKPNCGKSLLFNRLTGLAQKVANYPGVTVEVKSGRFGDYDLIDFPGIYSFNPLTKDEDIATSKLNEALAAEDVKVVVVTLDSTRLERSLFFGLQVQARAASHGKPVVFALNMIDELQEPIRCPELAAELGSPVLPLSAKTGAGLAEFKEQVREICEDPDTPEVRLTEVSDDFARRARALAQKYGPDPRQVLSGQNRLDRIFLSPVFGGLVFLATMAVLFQAIFTWAAPLMDLTEDAIGLLADAAASILPAGVFNDFVQGALFGGIGSFLVFLPQIAVLSFIIGALEDSGYLARAAIICHRPLSYFGLSGNSFVPYLSGHACAIPAIFAARNIPSPKRRLVTMLTVPLTACSARLPVYGLFVAALIPNQTILGGLIGLQGLTFLGLYVFGLVLALIASGILSRNLLADQTDAPFILELPPYRLPAVGPLVQKALAATRSFVTKAGGVIFTVAVIIWVLGYFPNGAGHLSESWLAVIGRWVAPVFEPLGLDWRFSVAIIMSFLAREVFVGTLGIFYGIEGAEDHPHDLAAQVQADGLSHASALALLVFYAIALQCVSTLAVLREETGSVKWPALAFAGYLVVAYLMAWAAYVLMI